MEIWTQYEPARWRRWADTGQVIESFDSWPPSTVLLVATREPDETERVCGTLRLFRHLANGRMRMMVGSGHPSAAWCASVLAAGADQVLLVPRSWERGRQDERNPEEKPPLQQAIELDADICPALHVRRDGDVILSVCGRHADRMVLARHHLERWCLAAKDRCPHWGGGSGG
ncbi:MAG: hypothetical protein JW797_08695 [Bradymonadales bacterium]|nr:hypothetical protein [Bradymonadales bacterium]